MNQENAKETTTIVFFPEVESYLKNGKEEKLDKCQHAHLPPSTSPSAAFSRKEETLWLPAGANPTASSVFTWRKSVKLR